MMNTQALNQAVTLMQQRQFVAAKNILTPLSEQQPAHAETLILLAQCQALLQHKQNAAQSLKRALEVHSDLKTINALAELGVKLELDLSFAIEAFQAYLLEKPDSQTALFNLAYYSDKNRQPNLAIDCYQQALKNSINNPEEVHINLAKIFSEQLADISQAEDHLELALQYNPDYWPALFNLANLKEQQGDRDAAFIYLERCLKIQPNHAATIARQLDLMRGADTSDLLLSSRKLAESEQSPDPDLLYAIGRACEKAAHFQDAWDYYLKANDLNAKTMRPYNPPAVERSINYLINTCDANWLNQSHASNQAVPVFITGMFRSGTTLLEQMLACHSRMKASGERSYLPQTIGKLLSRPKALEHHLSRQDLDKIAQVYLAESTENFQQPNYLIDKRPDNFLHLGFIRRIFPRAKFIILLRDWRDTSLSIFSHRLGPGQNYANDFENTKHYYQCHKKVVDHWLRLMPESTLAINYEALASSAEDQLKTICDFLELPYEEDMLNYHDRQSVVQTPSVWQVRQPLYQTAIGRWKNFKKITPNSFR